MNIGSALQGMLDPPWRYRSVAVLAGAIPLVLTLAACVRGFGPSPSQAQALPSANPEPPSRTPRGSDAGFAAAIFFALFAFRWPGFFHHPELNVDEAQTVAGAITLQFDPVYWRSVDGTTHGPLNDFVLLLPRLLGLPVNFATARAVGAALMGGALTAFWFGARRIWGEAVGRLAVLPPLAFFAFTTFWDFVHYTSEHLTIFLLTAAWAAEVCAAAPRPGTPPGLGSPARSRRCGGWILAGLLLGAVPFAKMQGGPAALALAAFGIWLICRGAPPEGARIRGLGAFGLALAAPALLCAAHLWVHGLGRDFWQSYILNNFRYSTETKMYSLSGMIGQIPGWLPATEGFEPYALGLGGFVIVTLPLRARFGRRAWLRIAFAAAAAALALYSTIAPGRVFHHYLLFMVIPWAGLGAAVLAAAIGVPAAPEFYRGRAWAVVAAFLLLGLGPQVWAKVGRPNPFLGDLRAYSHRLSPVSLEVLRYAHPGEPLGIWGYMPRYYVETGLPQASREGHNERQLIPQPQSAYYRARYLSDLARNRPPVFLDAVGPQAFWPHDRAAYGHETWPELNAWLTLNYRQVDDLDGVRIYVRKDRLPAK